MEKVEVVTVDPYREAAVGASCPVHRLRITALECAQARRYGVFEVENFSFSSWVVPR